MIRPFSALVIALLLLVFSSPTPASQSPSARSLVGAAVSAMGGEARLRGLTTIKLSGIGHRFLLEQSERPQGPWLVMYEQLAELRDVPGRRLRQSYGNRGVLSPEWSDATLVVAEGVAMIERGGRAIPGTPSQVDDAIMRLALGPERVVVSALDAKDLAVGESIVLQGVPHNVVTWVGEGARFRLFLNSHTSLPTAVETVRAYPYSTFWSVWGDVISRVYYSNWELLQGGLRYPTQWDEERNGQTYRSFTVTSVEVGVTADAVAFTIPKDVRAAYAASGATSIENMPLGRPERPAVDLAPGVVQIPGWWNVGIVKQDDGVVVIEAPISSGYSAKVLAEAERRFPGSPIKAVVSTSDAWPHLGGIREYVARGIPVYALDLNRAILERVLGAPRTALPDTLAKAPREPRFTLVGGRTTIGSGTNRLDLIPVRGEAGERMLVVYFAGLDLLYGSDLVQKNPDGTYFAPQYISELASVVAREKLRVGRVFAMHLGPTPWDEVKAASR